MVVTIVGTQKEVERAEGLHALFAAPMLRGREQSLPGHVVALSKSVVGGMVDKTDRSL